MRKLTRKCLVVVLALLMTWNMSSVAQAKGNNVKTKEYQVIAEAPYGGTSVVSYLQGIRFDGLAVLTTRSNPNTTLTYETGASETNFYSLGFGTINAGWIILEFKNPIQNGEGNDIQVVEDTWGLPYPKETAGIYVSNNKRDWKYLGDANNQNPISSYHTISEFDLNQVCLKEARYVRVQDKSLRTDFASLSPSFDRTIDGYDLNVVLALHDYVVEIEDGCHNGGDGHNDGGCYNDRWKKNNWFSKLCKWTWKYACNGFASYRW